MLGGRADAVVVAGVGDIGLYLLCSTDQVLHLHTEKTGVKERLDHPMLLLLLEFCYAFMLHLSWTVACAHL